MLKQLVALQLIFSLLITVPCNSASITRDLTIELPGNEKINKRSIDESVESSEEEKLENVKSLDDGSLVHREDVLKTPIVDNNSPAVLIVPQDPIQVHRSRRSADTADANGETDDMELAENGMVFLPLFRQKNNFGIRPRVARSIKEVENMESGDEMETAENGMVFRPLFRQRNGFVGQRVARSIDNNQNEDELETAENGLVFRPLFRQKNNFGQRLVRSIANVNNEESSDDDEMATAENGLVFRPLFRQKSNFGQRFVRSIANNKEGDNEMDTAENGMVFRPLFRSRNNFEVNQRTRRSVDASKTDEYIDDMETAANGIVFRPLFRTNNRYAVGQRSRRSVNYDSNISPMPVNLVSDLQNRRNFRTRRAVQQNNAHQNEVSHS